MAQLLLPYNIKGSIVLYWLVNILTVSCFLVPYFPFFFGACVQVCLNIIFRYSCKMLSLRIILFQVMGGDPLLKLIAVDWFKAEKAAEKIAVHPKCLVQVNCKCIHRKF